MVAKEFLIVALDPAADGVVSRLIYALRDELSVVEEGYDEGAQPLHASLAARFYGIAGSRMTELQPLRSEDGEVLSRDARRKGRLYEAAYRAAIERQPHAILCIGESVLYQRLAAAVRRRLRHEEGTFCNWDPLLIRLALTERAASQKTVASAPANDFDLVLNEGDAGEQTVFRSAARAIVQKLEERRAYGPLRANLV